MLSILNIVCQKGDIDIAKLLLENGAPVDVKNAADQTPLCFVKLLLTNRALTEVEDIKKSVLLCTLHVTKKRTYCTNALFSFKRSFDGRHVQKDTIIELYSESFENKNTHIETLQTFMVYVNIYITKYGLPYSMNF